MPSRRDYLAALAATGLAGCVGHSPGSAADSTADTATTPASPPSRPAVTIEAATVQYAYRHIQNVDWNAIRGADGQFVFVTIQTGEAEPIPGREAFGLVADGEVHEPEAIEQHNPVGLNVPGGPYVPEREGADPRGWLVFDVPAQLEEEPSLRLAHEAGSWEWELDVEKATTPPPAWEWTATAPETVAPDETFDITVSVENVGDGLGTFRGAVNFSYPLYQPKGFDVVLSPEESGEATVSATSRDAEPGTGLTYDVRTPTGTSSVTVTVASEPNSTESTD